MPVGLTKDAGWEIGVSRTLAFPAEAVWAVLTGAEGVGLWLGEGVRFPLAVGDPYETADGTTGEVRGFQEGRRVRLTHRPAGAGHETTVQVTVEPARTGTVLRFHQERMTGPDERERQRAHWKAVVDRVAAALAGGG